MATTARAPAVTELPARRESWLGDTSIRRSPRAAIVVAVSPLIPDPSSRPLPYLNVPGLTSYTM